MSQKSKIQLKKVTKLDLKLLIEWRNSKDVYPYNTQYFLLNSKIQIEWFNQLQNDNSKKMFMIMVDKIKIGICGLIDIDYENKNAKIAIIIGEKAFHEKGIGRRVISHLLKYGFEKLKLHKINSEVIEYNEKSIHLFEKSQFKLDATHRDAIWRENRWWNILSMSIFKKDFN